MRNATDTADSPEEALILVGPQGVIEGWSFGAHRLLGYSPEEVVGQPASELFVVAGPAGTLPLREVRSTRLTVRRRDGRQLHVTAESSPVPHRPSAVEWRLTVHEPFPFQNERSALVDWLFSQSTIALTIYDTDLRCLGQSIAMERLSGVSIHDRRGKALREVVFGRDAELWERQVRRVLETGEPAADFQVRVRTPADPDHDHVFSAVASPLRDATGETLGVCVTLNEVTEQVLASDRFTLLNEASALIGSSLDLVRTAQELGEVAVPRLSDFISVDLLEPLLQGDEPEPITGAAVLRRVAHDSVLAGVPEAVAAPGEVDVYPAHSPPAQCLASGLPVLLRVTDDTVLRWEAEDPRRAAKNRAYGFHSWMLVPLRARGVTLGVVLFGRWRSPEPFEQGDLDLACELVSRAAVCLDNVRRFTRERTAALTLQRNLLPRRTPEQAAVEVVSRYLPAEAQTGLGGDWFDVIPVSGARVALVVGDVVGHGIHAAATMGRLRTAVRTLADVDLSPDELLTHLDDQLTHLGAETENDEEGSWTTDIWATCLYAVYDPVSRRCSFACAGHPPPAVRAPDGKVELLDLPVGPPLGLGDLPFEVFETHLPEGSVLALYTDGLVRSRQRSLGAGIRQLETMLAAPASSLEALCDGVIDGLLPSRPEDDVALLIARTHALSVNQVAVREVPADPAIVAEARSWATEQLTAWGLEEVSFTTELVVSELVTNAIRYACSPIQLRLLKERNLICEVSDGSNTAPHLRRARDFDEGGRGLLLVAQLTDKWGTRHTSGGKTIWCEQRVPAQPPSQDSHVTARV
ncbi:SpoIIE family protein phosphatase [Streptomyces sp. PRKS01-29]|nr:SpoIIE family protein phosphatase [Streptomyces sabulosicollis]MBI0298849.1 SpoIIE family protein phosphatase [Streptomyces sabulosicollis]